MDEKIVKQFLQDTWEKLHGMPEVGATTPKTCAYLAACLKEFGYVVDADVAGGVVGVLDSGYPGLNFALRADTDALEFFVDGEKVVYHGCCHDAHSTILLAAAKELAETGIHQGKLYIIFQPGEEPNVGAKAMIETGKLDGIQEICGLHFVPETDVPHGSVASLLLHNGLGMLNAVITGKNAHGSLPQEGINAVEAGVLAINAANMVRCAPDKSWSCKVTQFSADRSSDNTIPDYARIAFDLRGESNEIMKELSDKVQAAIATAVTAVGATAKFDLQVNPAPNYDKDLAEFVEKTIARELGKERCAGHVRTGAGEDFHFFNYLRNMKNAYMAVGAKVSPALHVYNCTYDHEYIYISYKLLCALAHKKLG